MKRQDKMFTFSLCSLTLAQTCCIHVTLAGGGGWPSGKL